MRLRITLAATSLTIAISTGAAAPGDTSPDATTRTFSNVTAETLRCMEERSGKQHGTVYRRDAKNPNIVTSETHYFGLTRIVSDFDPPTSSVAYRILQKPDLASYAQVWDGVRNAIRACS
jgi:hypothetical protein